MNTHSRKSLWLPALLFLIAFLAVPISHLNGLALMPGDIGDARLNNYFLENIFQFFRGGTDSLWHLSFFYPFPFVLGFSDNLFGSAPVYLLARLITGQADTAFQIWFLCGYVANFSAAYYALRRLGGSTVAATIGALIFAFALPTTAHAGHAQLHYRFGIPLAIAFLVEFLESGAWRALLIAGAWLVWQFYAGVYMGFFTLLLMAAMILTHSGLLLLKRKAAAANWLEQVFSSWRAQSNREMLVVLVGFGLLLLILVLLFYPYLAVSRLYGVTRSWAEIASMLPRPQSYLLSDASSLWANHDARIFAGIPMRHEHQMFMGLAPLALALAGFIAGIRAKSGQTFLLMSGMLALVVGLTLYVGSASLWYLLHQLPLASAIRAVTRLDQVLLFPVAYLGALAIDRFKNRSRWVGTPLFVLIVALVIVEFSMTSMYVSPKEVWRQRLETLNSTIPVELSKESVLFIAQRQGPFFADELDAMWVSLERGVKTLNGYSGIFPPNYRPEYGNDCVELPRRLVSYINFSGQDGNEALYQDLVSRVVIVGFEDCDPRWFAVESAGSRVEGP